MGDWAKKAEDQEVSQLVDKLNIDSDTGNTHNKKCLDYDLRVSKSDEENEFDVAELLQASFFGKLGKQTVTNFFWSEQLYIVDPKQNTLTTLKY
ncbi:DEAD-box helicase Dbp80 isoform X12 [Drosophila yakuba]|uniref:DEAD-box helicase Dbp80 isoform X12 n=1 Tax=Drosophila yakuba TaxID=7245 RepID=UPI0019308503|nr:DEAD-box helicase Dbp80 isoform X12 [Drosophila yakuba]